MLEELLNKKNLDKKDIIFLLQLREKSDIEMLFHKADEVRRYYCGDEIHLRGIIEISNYCDQDCLYCGLRKSSKSIPRYKMQTQEIIQTAKLILDSGIRTVVLQSGETNLTSCEEIEEIILSIKRLGDCAITLSLGERDFRDYVIWKKAGADRYLLKHETADTKKYSIYHQGQALKERLDHLKFLKYLGYQIGSGNLIGLPKQTIEDIADDILLCRELEIDMASFSPFIPSPETPYRRGSSPTLELTLKVLAAGRIVLKNVHIPSTTALDTLFSDGKKKGLSAGANVIMPNFTPLPYKKYYAIYPGIKYLNESASEIVLSQKRLAENLGRSISDSKGESLTVKSIMPINS